MNGSLFLDECWREQLHKFQVAACRESSALIESRREEVESSPCGCQLPLAPCLCDPSIPQEEFLGPSGPKLETELKMSSWGLPAPGPKKFKTESKKSQKS